MQHTLRVDDLMTRLGKEERKLKNAGAYAEAAGVRDSIVIVCRMADEEPEEPPIDPSEGD